MNNTLSRWPQNSQVLITYKEIKQALEDGCAVYAIHSSLGGVGMRICDVKDRDNNPVKLYSGKWIDPHCIILDKDQQPLIQQMTLF